MTKETEDDVNWKEIKKRVSYVLDNMKRKITNRRTPVGYEDELIKLTIKIKALEK